MKLRFLIKIVSIVSIVSLCTSLGIYSFQRMKAMERQGNFNLFTLVPQDAMAVLEIDCVEDFNELRCCKDENFRHVSELLAYVKKYLDTLTGNVPHVLSGRMNEMLISFHEPDTPLNQVLYCKLGTEDYESAEALIRKCCSNAFLPKCFDYHGEKIHIYPMEDGRFLAVYFTQGFLAISLQKRLIEQVIDAQRLKCSLMEKPFFRTVCVGERDNAPLTVYVRLKEVDMDENMDDIQGRGCLESWAEFDIKFGENAVYCSRIGHGTDTIQAFNNILHKQKPLKGFWEERIPSATFFYAQWAVWHLEPVLNFALRQKYAEFIHPDSVKKREEEWGMFIKEHVEQEVMSCLFLSKDVANEYPYAVIGFTLKDEVYAEHCLQSMSSVISKRKGISLMNNIVFDYKQYPHVRKYSQYQLSGNLAFAQLTGISEFSTHIYACFYKGMLLISPNSQSLAAYINAVEKEDVLDAVPMYEEMMAALSSDNFYMIVDLDKALHHPNAYVQSLPSYFLRHSNFFRHFVMGLQFTCADEPTCSNMILLYKEQAGE